MTGKERAEEYAKRECENRGWCDLFIESESRRLEQAYLAGLAEGKPKWHDLRKDPNDLPQNKSDVIIFRGYYTFGFYETDEKVWLEFEYSNVYKDAENVIAWTDIPKF